MPTPPTLTFLLDTNEIIPAEPFGSAADGSIAQLISTCIQHRHRVVVHPANFDDLSRVKDHAEKSQKLAALQKYPRLAESPISENLEKLAGSSTDGSNDHRDLRLLAAIDSGAATYLVTEDQRLRKRATRAGLGQSIATVHEALDLLSQLHPADAVPPPTVELIESYNVDFRQDIFDSLRADYDEFDEWFRRKVAADAHGRRCWCVVDSDGTYDAIAIVKMEDDHPELARESATKISTFKVADRRAGEKVGELLLGAILEWAHGQPSVDTLFVEVKPDKEALVRFLEQFGFSRSGAPQKLNGDVTYVKRLSPPLVHQHSPFDYHVLYGPPAIEGTARTFVIPVQPHWYLGLFPDSPMFSAFGGITLGGLAAPPTPFGNAIRKAYLCRSPTRSIPQGATLLFYRSADGSARGQGGGAVHAIGVAEKSMRTSESERILSFVGRRTVYSSEDVSAMCESGSQVLATLFRHDHYLDTPWTLNDLKAASVLRGAPQSVTEVKSERGLAWITNQLAG